MVHVLYVNLKQLAWPNSLQLPRRWAPISLGARGLCLFLSVSLPSVPSFLYYSSVLSPSCPLLCLPLSTRPWIACPLSCPSPSSVYDRASSSRASP